MKNPKWRIVAPLLASQKGSHIISFMLSISFSGVKIIDRKYIEDDEDDDTRHSRRLTIPPYTYIAP